MIYISRKLSYLVEPFIWYFIQRNLMLIPFLLMVLERVRIGTFKITERLLIAVSRSQIDLIRT